MPKIIITVLLTCLFFNILVADEIQNSTIKKANDDLYKIANITINKEKREIIFPAEFNMEKGMIELILCGKHGKLHESVLKTDIVPSHLQVALLLLGFGCKQNSDYQDKGKIPKSDSLLIFAEWIDSLNNIVNVRIEQLAYNLIRKKEMMETHWIFQGSMFVEGHFMADIEESIITTYHDPYSIIDNPLETRNDDMLYSVNSRIVPSKGTKAKIIIRPNN